MKFLLREFPNMSCRGGGNSSYRKKNNVRNTNIDISTKQKQEKLNSYDFIIMTKKVLGRSHRKMYVVDIEHAHPFHV